MSLSELDIDEADASGTAITLLAVFGNVAGQLALEQADKLADRPDLAARWRTIADTVNTLTMANHLMELALDLCDTVGETSVPPHLDAAIVQLGIRKSDGRAPETGLAALNLDERHLRQQTEHHLELAKAEPDVAGKRLHLDIAARYATLRELALRATSAS